MNSSEAEKDARVGFDEVAEEAEREVGDHEEFEGVAGEEGRRWSLVGGRWHPGFVGAVGVLRLRRDFASLRHGFAQDDNFVFMRRPT